MATQGLFAEMKLPLLHYTRESLALMHFTPAQKPALTSYLWPVVRAGMAAVKINLRLSSRLEYQQSKQTGLNNTIYTTYQLH